MKKRAPTNSDLTWHHSGHSFHTPPIPHGLHNPTTTTTTPPHKRAQLRFKSLPVPKGLGFKSGSGRNNFSPAPGELPIVICKIQIIGCTQLLAKDRNGASDPFVVVSVLLMRHQTPVAKRTLNPVYNPKDATFEFPLYLSLADKLVGVELVV
ncbi:uncharacterized protein LACBIDRAFT_310706 [Laccaria bicolor S238N-H82]|uniref:Predicted protein n=1 Tax=Laccaria bicolor (strain S238N-H82 / ATCC MYA-4686) TaxID=486041 RepID=B0DUX8_LACBS|nr:uncharacterized protein LACBIDRAFT_310706 [Laccaria bicolor S238N-H82]EDR01686.1 predicted protein [Laccaria bicolor S238N-H82]|eukprot:XP_001887762.1 predicted protein [Laccaria bicolor S238N-H82]